MKDVDNITLWNSFLQGDKEAYAELYKRYVNELYTYGMSFTTDKDLIKDCIQELYLKLYKNRRRLKRTENVKAYLLLALKNSLFNVFKKEKELFQLENIEPVFSPDYSIEEKIIENESENERKKILIKILDSLTPKQKEVLDYRFVKEFSISQIGVLMGMNYQSVQNLLQRSIKHAKTKLF